MVFIIEKAQAQCRLKKIFGKLGLVRAWHSKLGLNKNLGSFHLYFGIGKKNRWLKIRSKRSILGKMKNVATTEFFFQRIFFFAPSWRESRIKKLSKKWLQSSVSDVRGNFSRLQSTVFFVVGSKIKKVREEKKVGQTRKLTLARFLFGILSPPTFLFLQFFCFAEFFYFF